MKILSNNSDLVEYGINPLTGEACRYSMRVLCDLSEKGCALVAAFMGMHYDPALPPGQMFNANWNTKVCDDTAVASVMLTRGALNDLCMFALLYKENCDIVIRMASGSLHGYHKQDGYYDRVVSYAQEHADTCTVTYNHNSAPGAGDRNTHAFTGRTE